MKKLKILCLFFVAIATNFPQNSKASELRFCPSGPPELTRMRPGFEMEMQRPVLKDLERPMENPEGFPIFPSWITPRKEAAIENSIKNGDYIDIPDGTVINKHTVWDANLPVVIRGSVFFEPPGGLTIKPGTPVLRKVGYVWEKKGLTIRTGSYLKAEGRSNDLIVFLPNPIPDYDDSWGCYNWAVHVQEGASAKISNCRIFGAWLGIWAQGNVQISNTETWNCKAGVYAEGSNGSAFQLKVSNSIGYNCSRSGVTYYLDDVNGIADPSSIVEISGCTFTGFFYGGYAHDYGIEGHGVKDPNKAGTVILKDNLITSSWAYGVGLFDGYMRSEEMKCHCYWNNIWDKNPDNPLPDIKPQFDIYCPFTF